MDPGNPWGLSLGAWAVAGLLLLAAVAEAATPVPDIVVAPGYQAEVAAVGLADPVDLAIDRPGSLVVLDRGNPAGSSQVVIRLPLPAPGDPPTDARTAPRVEAPTGQGGLAYPAGAIALHPTSGAVFLSELGGKRLYRIGPDGGVSLYASGFWMLPRTAIRFAPDRHLLVVDFPGQRAVPEMDPYAEERDLLGESREPEGVVAYRINVDEALPLPRQAAHWRPSVALPLRSAGKSPSPDWNGGIAVGPGGSLFLATLTSLFHIDGAHFTPHGHIGSARTPTVCPSGEPYVFQERAGYMVLVHVTGGMVVRVGRKGDVEEVVGNLGGSHGLVCDDAGTLYVADGLRGRILRLSRVSQR